MMREAGEPSTVDVAWVRYVTLCPPHRGSSWSHHSRPRATQTGAKRGLLQRTSENTYSTQLDE
jgi:hypothetical protein